MKFYFFFASAPEGIFLLERIFQVKLREFSNNQLENMRLSPISTPDHDCTPKHITGKRKMFFLTKIGTIHKCSCNVSIPHHHPHNETRVGSGAFMLMPVDDVLKFMHHRGNNCSCSIPRNRKGSRYGQLVIHQRTQLCQTTNDNQSTTEKEWRVQRQHKTLASSQDQ